MESGKKNREEDDGVIFILSSDWNVSGETLLFGGPRQQLTAPVWVG